MARIEYVKLRLEAWARWSHSSDSGGLGYPRAAAFTRMTPRSSDGSYLPVGDDEAMRTERAVQSLRFGHRDLWDTLQDYYIQGFDIARCATRRKVALSSIKARLCRADAVLDAWFAAQAEIAEKQKKNKTP